MVFEVHIVSEITILFNIHENNYRNILKTFPAFNTHEIIWQGFYMGCEVGFAELFVIAYCSGATMDGKFYKPMSQLEDAIVEFNLSPPFRWTLCFYFCLSFEEDVALSITSTKRIY